MKENRTQIRKRIVFFDGDGTLWYPKTTKRTVAPYKLYQNLCFKEALAELVLTPAALDVLTVLKRFGIITVVISTHPHTGDEAASILERKVNHLGLKGLLSEYYPSPPLTEAKGQQILDILAYHNLPKSSALMVGDSYSYDFLSAQKVGVESFFIKNDYSNVPHGGALGANCIEELDGIMGSVIKPDRRSSRGR